jgi:hypothetical protein
MLEHQEHILIVVTRKKNAQISYAKKVWGYLLIRHAARAVTTSLCRVQLILCIFVKGILSSEGGVQFVRVSSRQNGPWPPWNCCVRGQAVSPEWGDSWICSRFCCKRSYILTNKRDIYICQGIQRSAFCFRTVAGSSCCWWWFPASQVVNYILHYNIVNSCMSELHCYAALQGFIVGFFGNGVRNGFSY